MSFITDSFKVPERYVTKDFIIKKLCYADAALDYKAAMSSIDIIHQTRGGTWPTKNLSFLDNQIDLAWHQREFEFRSSFAYTVMSLDEEECLGCLYIYPPGFRGDVSKSGGADISFWVTQKAYDQGLYIVLYQTIEHWLDKDWPIKNYIFTNVKIPQ